MDFANVQNIIRNLERKVQILTKIIQLTNQWAQNEFGVTIPDHILAYKLDEKTNYGGGAQCGIKCENIDDLTFDLDLVQDTAGDQERSSSADLFQNRDYLFSNSSLSSRSQLFSSSRGCNTDPIVLLERLPNDHPIFKKFKISSKSKSNDFNCGTCGIVFRIRKDLKEHLSTTGHRRYVCSTCSDYFDSPSHLKKHEEIHIVEKTIECPNCDKKFTTICNRDMHLARKVCKTLGCPIEDCGMKFATLDKLKAHTKLHDPNIKDDTDTDETNEPVQGSVNKFECDFCHKFFKYAKGLRHHCLKVHDEEINNCKYRCTWPGCGKGFQMEAFFRRHLTNHLSPADKSEPKSRHKSIQYKSKPKPDIRVICDQCGKHVKKYDLKKHVERVHFQKKRAKCTYPGCNKSFYTQSEMRNCVRKHKTSPEDKLCHVCDQCGKRFSMKRTLVLHILAIHQKLKPHKCTVGDCTRTFSEKKQLTVHYSIHLNPKRPEFNEEFSQNCPYGLKEILQSRKNTLKKYHMKIQKAKSQKPSIKIKLKKEVMD